MRNAVKEVGVAALCAAMVAQSWGAAPEMFLETGVQGGFFGDCQTLGAEIRVRFSSSGQFSEFGHCLISPDCFPCSWSTQSVDIAINSTKVQEQIFQCLQPETCTEIFFCTLPYELSSDQPFWTNVWTNSNEGGFNRDPRLCYSIGSNIGWPTQICFTRCVEDFDASGIIDFADMSLLLMCWGSVDTFQRLDLDASGQVDGADLSLFLMVLGPCES